MNEQDKHWQEVLKHAEQHGFIIQAYGGVASLATHEVQKEYFTEEKYELLQRNQGGTNFEDKF